MNELHLEFLSSPGWAAMLETDLLPWVQRAGDLGDDVLEIGPGPGLTTDLLRERVVKLTALEMDPSLSAPLAERLSGTNVEVVCGDGTERVFEPDRFSAVTCFSMLHHMPSPEHQDRLFAEMARVLRPGGIFVGADSLDSEGMRAGHVGDTFVPVSPYELPDRLSLVGLSDTEMDVGEYQFRFISRKPRRQP